MKRTIAKYNEYELIKLRNNDYTIHNNNILECYRMRNEKAKQYIFNAFIALKHNKIVWYDLIAYVYNLYNDNTY